MNKKVIVVCMLVLAMSLSIFAASKKQEMWQKAITEKNLELRLQYLKEYEAEFGKKQDKFHKYLYLNLSETAFQLTQYDEAITFGEKALTFEDLDDASKLRIYLSLANAYKITKKDMEKAYHYSGLVIEMGLRLIKHHENSEKTQAKKEKYINNYKAFYVGPAYRIQAQLLYEKGKDNPENIKEGAKKACAAYETDKTDRSSKLAFNFAVSLYRKKLTDDAINTLEMIIDKEKAEYSHSYLLANLYNRKKDKTKAAYYFELAYKADRKARLALNIGKLVYKENINKGIKYFAEAFVLSKSNKQSDAYKFLQQLYFNQLAKDKSPAEQEKGFKAIINAARARLGLQPLAGEAPPAAAETSDTQ
jgi:hypothetical protein